MSARTLQNSIKRTQDEISGLQKKLTNESKKEAQKLDRIVKIKKNITKNTSPSSLKNKQREIERLEKDIVTIQKTKAELTKRVADKTTQLHKHQQHLLKEQDKEQKKLYESIERKENEAKARQAALLQQIDFSTSQPNSGVSAVENTKYDAFISHASEDKDDLVRPLAEKLQKNGFSVWYDEFQLKVGDSLRRSIDRGLKNSRFGIVVLSPDFFAKNWPQYELDGLVAKEMTGGKVVLPLWHKVSKNEVIAYSPSLADKVALSTTTYTIDELARGLGDALQESAEQHASPFLKTAQELELQGPKNWSERLEEYLYEDASKRVD